MAIPLLGVNGFVPLPSVACLAPSGAGFSKSEIVFTIVSVATSELSPACLERSRCAMAVSGARVDGGSELACMRVSPNIKQC